MSLSVIKKRNGVIEAFNPDKLNKWAEWASEVGVEITSSMIEE